jgi:hypothetical protein
VLDELIDRLLRLDRNPARMRAFLAQMALDLHAVPHGNFVNRRFAVAVVAFAVHGSL